MAGSADELPTGGRGVFDFKERDAKPLEKARLEEDDEDDAMVDAEFLLPDTERRKDLPQQLVRMHLSGDVAQRLGRAPQLLGGQFARTGLFHDIACLVEVRKCNVDLFHVPGTRGEFAGRRFGVDEALGYGPVEAVHAFSGQSRNGNRQWRTRIAVPTARFASGAIG